jgi:hypothetical protein
MAMEATKRLLKVYQNTAINLRRVADEMVEREYDEQLVVNSRTKAVIYENVANEIKLALTEDKVDLDE